MTEVIAGGVEDSKDNDGVASNAVEELVGEALGQDAPEFPIVEWKALGRLFQTVEGVCHAEKELAAQAPAPLAHDRVAFAGVLSSSSFS